MIRFNSYRRTVLKLYLRNVIYYKIIYSVYSVFRDAINNRVMPLLPTQIILLLFPVLMFHSMYEALFCAKILLSVAKLREKHIRSYSINGRSLTFREENC